MTEKRLYTVIDKEEPRGQSVALNGIPCTARHCVGELNNLHEENRTLIGRIQEYEEILQSDNLTDLETEIARLREENQHIKHTIQWMLENERTTIGQNTLRQLQEVIND